MENNLSGQEKVDALNIEYKEYIETIKRSWASRNQVESTRVYEVMYPFEQAEVEGKINAWEIYITPFAETWWKERGFGVVWPKDNSKPIQVYELEAKLI